MILNYKIIISAVAVLLSFVGYGIYIRDILKRKIKPHSFTFLIWSITSSIIWALQVHGGAGVGAWITFDVSAICIFIFFLSLKYGEKNITLSDILFLILSIIGLLLWIIAKKPILSIILLVLTEIFGFLPTVRKSWDKPYKEGLFTWALTAFRHGLGIIALEKFNILTLLYPVAWVFANSAFCIFIIIRRRKTKIG